MKNYLCARQIGKTCVYLFIQPTIYIAFEKAKLLLQQLLKLWVWYIFICSHGDIDTFMRLLTKETNIHNKFKVNHNDKHASICNFDYGTFIMFVSINIYHVLV